MIISNRMGVTFFEPIERKIEIIPSSDPIPRTQYEVVYSELNQIMHKINDARSRDSTLYIPQNIRNDFNTVLEKYDHTVIIQYPVLQKLTEQIYINLNACQREDESKNEMDEEYMTVSKKINNIKNQIDKAGDNFSVDILNNIYNEFDAIMLSRGDIIAKNLYLSKLIDEIMNSVWQ